MRRFRPPVRVDRVTRGKAVIPKRFRLAVGAALTVTLSSATLFAYSASAGSGPEAADRATVDAFARIADDVLSQRTQALVEEQPGHRNSGPSSAKTRMTAQLKKDEDAAISSLQSRKTRLAALGEAYTGATTHVAVDRATVTGGKATVEVSEDTTLAYKKLRGDERTTDFRTRYELTLTSKRGGAWELTSIKSLDNGPVAINEPVAAKTKVAKDDGNQYPDGTPASTKYPAPAKPKAKTGGAYDYTAMAKYAEKYWSNYNPAYRKFGGAGATAPTSSARRSRRVAGRPFRAPRRTTATGRTTAPARPTPGSARTSGRGSRCPTSGPPTWPTSTRRTSVTSCRWTSTGTGPRTIP